MWLFTQYGFFSVTQHLHRKDNIQIRARTDQDLKDLKAAFPALDRCPIIETQDADYQWRIVLQRWKWELVGAELMKAIDYSNFKGKIATVPTQKNKSHMLHNIWHEHHDYQRQRHPRDPMKGHPSLFRGAGDELIGDEHGFDEERNPEPKERRGRKGGRQ